MSTIFLQFVNISITAGWIVLAVILLRLLLKKAPKWMNCLLWGIVGIRLVFPFSIESVLSLIPSKETITTTQYSSRPYIETGFMAVDKPINNYLGDRYFEGVTVPTNHFANLTTILAIIWLPGTFIMLSYSIISYLRLRRNLRTATIYMTMYAKVKWCPLHLFLVL